MEDKKRLFILMTFFFALGAITLISVSLGTNHWVESDPRLKIKSNTSNTPNKVNFGLFKGDGVLNHGTGARIRTYSVVCSASKGKCVMFTEGDTSGSGLDYINEMLSSNTTGETNEDGLFNYSYWLLTIVCASLGIVFGMISMGFAVLNVFGKPIETITGPMGLYLWNGIAVLFVVLEMIFYLVMFFSSLKKNYIIAYNSRYNVDDYTTLGYSFYLVPGAGVLYLANLIMLLASGYQLRCSFSSEAEKVVDNGMILY